MEFGKVGNQIISPPTRPPQNRYHGAIAFYKQKLADYAEMPRYNQMMGAICSEQGNVDDAEKYYRQAFASAPGNILIKNDFAVHLANHGRKDDALKELNKAMLMTEHNETINHNMAAVLGNSGNYRKALDYAVKTSLLNDHSEANHRNIARIQATLGDNDSSLEHNLKAIAIQEHDAARYNKPIQNTTAYRKAAVQMVSKGVKRDDAIALMHKARELENKHVTLVTTERTNEILKKIQKQQERHLHELEQARLKAEQERRMSYGSWQSVVDKVPD
jgi:tetratricopeptide (TPR) repeat protein